jgi:hypothetical protein
VEIAMKIPLQIGELENAINSYKRARPFSDGILPIELRLMATLYGKMIYLRLTSWDLDVETAPTQVVVEYWAATHGAHRARMTEVPSQQQRTFPSTLPCTRVDLIHPHPCLLSEPPSAHESV